jgi:hypothetical protein
MALYWHRDINVINLTTFTLLSSPDGASIASDVFCRGIVLTQNVRVSTVMPQRRESILTTIVHVHAFNFCRRCTRERRLWAARKR